MNFKSMSVEKLTKLIGDAEAALRSKVSETRRSLESQLARLANYATGAPRSRRGGVRGKVAPKYRNPANPSETWAGRGLKPRWLVAALKTGKKLEYFSVESPAKGSPKKTARKAKAARKARKFKARKPRAAGRARSGPVPSSSSAAQP